MKTEIEVKYKHGGNGEVEVRGFCAKEAGVARGRAAKWDDFELMGGSNREEEEYEAPAGEAVRMRGVIRKIKQRRFGVLGVR